MRCYFINVQVLLQDILKQNADINITENFLDSIKFKHEQNICLKVFQIFQNETMIFSVHYNKL